MMLSIYRWQKIAARSFNAAQEFSARTFALTVNHQTRVALHAQQDVITY